MSGGSFNYLWCNESDSIINKQSDIQDMIFALKDLNIEGSGIAMINTDKILSVITQYQNKIDSMLNDIKPVWRAVELYKSNDACKGELEKVLKEYKENYEN